jgi:hypothetical protein
VGSGLVGGTQATIGATAAATIGLLVEGATAQTADLAQFWQTTAGPTVAGISKDGQVYARSFSATPGSASVVVETIRGFTGQTADLTQWQDSTNAVKANVDSQGVIHSGPSWLNGNNGSFPAVMAVPTNVGQPGVAVKALAGQTADLQQWQLSSGTKSSWITNDGTAVLAAGRFNSPDLGYLNARLSVVANSAGEKGAIVRGAGGQTANLQEWQNSAGTANAYIDHSGNINTASAGFYSNLAAVGLSAASAWNVLASAGGGIPVFIVKADGGNASDLQQWIINNGALGAKVTAGGNVQGTGAYTTLSDESVKTNIGELRHDPLQVLRRLHPVHFDYIGGDRDQIGFIANEVEPILPHAVRPFDTLPGGIPDHQGRLGLQSDAILAYAIGAIQSIDKRLSVLEAK